MLTARELREVLENLLESQKQLGVIDSWKVQVADRFFTQASDYGVRILVNDKVIVERWVTESGNNIARLRKTAFFLVLEVIMTQGILNLLNQQELVPNQ